MSETIYEQLSALVDEELPVGEHVLLMERLSRDAGLRERLGRYQLVNDVLNNRVAMPVDEGFSHRVMQALDADPAYHRSPLAAWQKQLLKPLAGVAVAASVALVAVLSVQSLNRGTAPAQAPQLASTKLPASAPQLASARLPAQDVVRVQQGQWDRQAPEVRSRLNGYLVHHNEYAASSGVQGVLPYVRIVGYDSGNE